MFQRAHAQAHVHRITHCGLNKHPNLLSPHTYAHAHTLRRRNYFELGVRRRECSWEQQGHEALWEVRWGPAFSSAVCLRSDVLMADGGQGWGRRRQARGGRWCVCGGISWTMGPGHKAPFVASGTLPPWKSLMQPAFTVTRFPQRPADSRQRRFGLVTLQNHNYFHFVGLKPGEKIIVCLIWEYKCIT